MTVAQGSAAPISTVWQAGPRRMLCPAQYMKCHLARRQPSRTHLHAHAAQQQAHGVAVAVLEARHRGALRAARGHRRQREGLVALLRVVREACMAVSSVALRQASRPRKACAVS